MTNILSTPSGPQTIPVTSPSATRNAIGTFWSLQRSNQPPWPTRIFPELPTYQLSSNHFIVDDRSVDYAALHLLRLAQQSTNEPPNIQSMSLFDYSSTTNLWLEIPTNGVVSNIVNLIVHNTVQDLPYGLLTKTDLSFPYWLGEQTITGAVGNATSAVLQQNNRTNLYIWARTGPASTITIITQPISQLVAEDDTVTFSVVAVGSGTLAYQWMLNGDDIPNATARSYSIENAWWGDEGDYSVRVSNGEDTVTSQSAELSVGGGLTDPLLMALIGSRQDYTFKDNMTYIIDSPVDLYGTTTIKGGTVLKFEWLNTNATLRVHGTLICDTAPYFPAILTAVDDNAAGVRLEAEWLTGNPQPRVGRPPYLDLTMADSNSKIHDLRISYANEGVTTPAGGRLDVWNCQFLKCDRSIVNDQGGWNALHNVLFSQCGYAVHAGTNHFSITAEHVTSDSLTFWDGSIEPDYIGITNTLHSGEFLGATNLSYQNVVFYPAPGNFQTNGVGRYYLNPTSQLHHAGTTNVSPALLTALKNKSTYPPMHLPAFMKISGEMTLFPQVPRYSNGAPDLGYHYDVLDYTVGSLTLDGGKLSIMPGTAIGCREEFSTAHNMLTAVGFDVRENSTLVGRGLPDKPVIIVDAQLVQEQFSYYCFALVLPDFFPHQGARSAPRLDFEFTHWYASAGRNHVWSGLDETYKNLIVPSAMVDWNMKNCQLRGGKISLGAPRYLSYFGLPEDFFFGSCVVNWENNLFDGVALFVNPTWYWVGRMIDCDMKFSARNNLIRNPRWFVLGVIPTSAGNWELKDNHFDTVQIEQFRGAPLDFDHNGYWPQMSANQTWNGYANRLLDSTDTNFPSAGGAGEVYASSVPPYQAGPYGKHYLPMANPLYHLGSRPFEESGLAQYTSRADQFTEGQELPGHAVNIGLHYVASQTNQSSAINYQLPRDTDGDGIADYIEDKNGNNAVDADETSRVLAQTMSEINDATNAVYDDIDLSGSGLVGRIKRALGQGAFEKNNPLTLKQITTGEEPDFATFEVPVSFDALTNSGNALSLQLNGVPAQLEECTRATNGNCLLSFNVAFDPAGLHFLTGAFRLGSDPRTENPVMTASGMMSAFYSSNSVQFFEAGSMFDSSGGFLDAKLFANDADYQIDLYDTATTPATLIRTITNSTSNGFIEENWDGMLADGVTPFTNSEVRAEFSVAYANNPGNVSTNKPKKYLTKAEGSLSEGGTHMNFVFFRSPTNDAWEVEFAKNGAIWNALQGVVDVLIKPNLGYPVYQSHFNRYTPPPNGEYPGYITKRSRATNDPPNLPTVLDTLLPSMTNSATRQIYIYGHGTNGAMANYNDSAYIWASDVSSRLRNNYTKAKGLMAQNPYRFVWLDGCSTASGKDWRRAFGIYPIGKGAQKQAANNKTGPQAYIGWENVHAGGLNRLNYTPAAVDSVKAYANTLNTFYSLWMQGFRVKQCIDEASKVTTDRFPLPVPENKTFTVTINNAAYLFTNITTSKIFIVGFPGLQIDRTDHALDGDKRYAAPENLE